MNRKGFAASGILYTILLIFLAIIYMLLMNFKNKKNLLDQMKSEVLNSSKLCEEKVGRTFTFDYTGEAQEFVAECEGEYKIELWGASGNTTNPLTFDYNGTTYQGGIGGKGAYTSGKIELSKNTKLYMYVGGSGSPATSTTESNGGGYNGGGNNRLTKANATYAGSGGGGATDVRFFGSSEITDSDLEWNSDLGLKSRIMVAGAGGGGAAWNQTGGAGGGLNGYNGEGDPRSTAHLAGGGTQTSGGVGSGCGTSDSNNSWCSQTINPGTFGIGGSGIPQADGGPGGSGGSGYYGGGAGGDGYSYSGGGGSSYISGHAGSLAITSSESTSIKNGCNNLTDANELECSTHYSGLYFTNTQMIDGQGYEWTTEKGSDVVGMPTHDGESTMNGNSGNGYAKITYLGKKVIRTCESQVGEEYTFEYTGDAQTFTVPCNGYYKVELWGAQGGADDISTKGGYGAYTSGAINLTANLELQVYVGEKPTGITGGFNGGGDASPESADWHGYAVGTRGGGGATDIRLDSSINSRIMVAGAGGGYNNGGDPGGGAAGGLTAYTGDTNTGAYGESSTGGTGGTQVSGGTKGTGVSGTDATNGSFYAGGTGGGLKANVGNSNNTAGLGSGGGGGYYGGGGGGRGGYGGISNDGGHAGGAGGGGSSYISGHAGSLAIAEGSALDPRALKNGCTSSSTSKECSIHYSGLYFTNTNMIDGKGHTWKTSDLGVVSTNLMPKPTGGYYDSGVGHNGNGYAKITYLGTNYCPISTGESYSFDYNGDEQTFTPECSGKYQLEVWGAQGGSFNTTNHGGYGSYATGVTTLNKDTDTLSVVVGGAPANNTSTGSNSGVGCSGSVCGTINGGFNGGGTAYRRSDVVNNAGGGATHIAKNGTLGELKNYSSDTSPILIVAAGGGGAAYYSSSRYGVGGNAGGITGGNGSYGSNSNCESYGYGGTQTAGGSYYVLSGFYTSTNIPAAGFGYGGIGETSVGGDGGGAGWYGGRGNACIGGGGGGSSYIASDLLISNSEVTKHMTCYSCTTSDDVNTKTVSNTCLSATATANCSKTGNGYAKITYLGNN